MSRHIIETIQSCMQFNRERTLGTLKQVAELPDSAAALGWRAAEGRAHIAWQLLHVGITEELFATERITGDAPEYADMVPRFRGGSTPDDDIPSVDEIRDILNHSREHVMATLSKFSDDDLGTIPEPLQERGWDLRKVIDILNWHEAHHQGQAHATLNLFKAQAGL